MSEDLRPEAVSKGFNTIEKELADARVTLADCQTRIRELKNKEGTEIIGKALTLTAVSVSVLASIVAHWPFWAQAGGGVLLAGGALQRKILKYAQELLQLRQAEFKALETIARLTREKQAQDREFDSEGQPGKVRNAGYAGGGEGKQ